MPEAAPGTPRYGERIADNGPLYVETNFARTIREPCNALTAALFIVLVVYWLWRMRGRYRRHPFTCLCMPILLAGGIGGTVFHGLRMHPFWFWLDVIPIFVLVLAGAVYLWIRIRPRLWHILIVAASWLSMQLPFVFARETHSAIIIHYISLALLILIPVTIVLVRTRGRHSNLIKLTVVCFGIGILFRYIDPESYEYLPGLGTHWLWHIFGATTTAALAEYFYRLETEPIGPLPGPQSITNKPRG